MTYNYKKALILSAICVLTFVCFRYTLHNQFTNWDDDYYVTNDPYIKAFTAHNLKVIFTEDITKNNYHPLCMLSLAVNYHFSQMNPEAYYFTNVLIQIANVMLVFFLMMGLCALLAMNDEAKLFVASFSALWFGIHPMHVESVAWIAERKDVLYAFFYVLGLLAYLRYLHSGKMSWYWVTFLVFVASCLSKPMAVVFPISLLCVDFLAAFYTQNKTGAIASFGTLTIWERLMYASYGFIQYISKIFNPTYLSTFYPYPYRYITGYLPGIYYAAPILSIAFAFLIPYLTYKYKREYFRVVTFGIAFFVANVMFVLQFISVGAAIMSDRYSYVAYIGLFFLIAWLLQRLISLMPSIKTAVIAVLLLLSAGLSYACYERTFVWHDAETLLSDAIEKYPYRALLSYKWLGNYYFDKGNLDKALENYGVLTQLHSADAKIYDRIGNIYTLKKDYKTAIENYDQSLAIQNNVSKTYVDRSIAYSLIHDSIRALKDFVVSYQLTPESEKMMADSVFGIVQRRDYDLAIKQYSMLVLFNPNNPFYYFYRGVSYFGTNRMQKAIEDWERAIKYNSKDVKLSASYNLSVAYDSIGNPQKAVYYVLLAQSLGYQVNPDFAKKLQDKAKLHITLPAHSR
jgi:tetratricopeptide (TPR) repeat protein